MKLNFSAYITAQKMRVRADHDGELVLITRGQARTIYGATRPVRDSEDVFNEIDGLCGLNQRERAAAANRRSAQFARSRAFNIA